MAIKIGGSKIINDSYEWDGHDLVPNTDDTYDLGSTGKQWKNIYIKSYMYVDGIADINKLKTDWIGTSLLPDQDNTYDLGSSTKEWKDLYVDGTGNIDIVKSIYVESVNGYKIGDTGYVIDGLGRWSGRDLVPDQDDTYDLGSSTKEWKDLYVDGIGYIDTLSPHALVGQLFNMSQSGVTGVGFNALNSSSTGINNSAFGAATLQYNTSGYMNTAAGAAALQYNTTGYMNSAFGVDSLTNNTTGHSNTAFGFAALYGAEGSGGDSNTAIGYNTMKSNTSGYSNVALGKEALQRNTEGHYNVALGQEALEFNTTGAKNTVTGVNALRNNISGEENIASGYCALMQNTTGNMNTVLGTATGYSVTTGSNNLLLGADAGTNYSPSGNITTESNIVCLGNNAITSLYCKDSSISTSDERDKNDIKTFSLGLDFVNKLRPVTYKWDMRSDYLTSQSGLIAGPQTIEDVTNDGSHMKPRIETGLIAQEVLSLLEEAGYANDKNDMLMVNLNEDGTSYGLVYERIIPILVNAIQDLSLQLKELKNGN